MNPAPPHSPPFPDAQAPVSGPPSPPLAPRLGLLVGLALAVVLAFALPLILAGNVSGRGGFDQFYFHEPTTRGFLLDWPHPRLAEYMSATTPGYHLVLALAARTLGDDLATLRLVSLGFSVAWLALAAGAVAVLSRPSGTPGLSRPGLPLREAVAILLPLLSSIYVLFPAAWLQPDNAGWLLVLGVLLLALRPRFGLGFAAAGGTLLLALVLVRQSHVWAAGPLLAAAWLGARGADLTALGAGRVQDLLTRLPARVSRSLIVAAAILPAFAAILYFSSLWGGLTPPHFHNQYPQSHNAAAPAFVLSLLGIYSVFFAGYLLPHAREIVAKRWWLLPAAALVGVALAVVPDTTYLWETRSSGLWNIVKVAPVVPPHTSVVLLVFSPLGAAAAVTWVLPLAPRPRWIMIAALVAFTVAQTVNPLAWQRYVEPFFLMLLPIMVCLLPRPLVPRLSEPRAALVPRLSEPRVGAWPFIDRLLPAARLLGPLALAALLALLTVRAVLRPDWLPPAQEPSAAAPSSAALEPFASRSELARFLGRRVCQIQKTGAHTRRDRKGACPVLQRTPRSRLVYKGRVGAQGSFVKGTRTFPCSSPSDVPIDRTPPDTANL